MNMYLYLLRRFKHEVNKFKILQLAKEMLSEKEFEKFLAELKVKY
jgi:hypothetical protein